MPVRAHHSRSADDSHGVGVALPVPDSLEVHTFWIGTEEYVVLSFEAAPERRDIADQAIGQLSQIEQEIVALVQRGLSNAEIGRVRGTSPSTIANQLTAIYRKLGLHSRRELRATVPTGGAR